jgi:thioesterase domain-containing protein
MAGEMTSPAADLETELLRLWKKLLNRVDLSIDDDFFESGGDSLLATELLFEVEQLVRNEISPSLLFETGTVRQLAERLRGAVAPQLAVVVGSGERRLLHFFHGDFDNGGVSVRRIAAMLGPDRPMLAIAPHGMFGEQLPDSIEEMAADRLPLILEAQRSGPYLLGGHCNGALVAFEAARLLIKAGHQVDLVVMIDPVTLTQWWPARLYLLGHSWLKRGTGTSTEELESAQALAWAKLAGTDKQLRNGQLAKAWKKRWKKEWKKLRHRLSLKPQSRSKGAMDSTSGDLKVKAKRTDNKQIFGQIPHGSELMKSYWYVLSRYYPSPLEVPVFYVALGYSGGGWKRVSRDMELVDLPGRHIPTGESMIDAMDSIRDRLNTLDVQSQMVSV